jgi:hypothetical protein
LQEFIVNLCFFPPGFASALRFLHTPVPTPASFNCTAKRASPNRNPFFICLGLLDLVGAAVLWTVARERNIAKGAV